MIATASRGICELDFAYRGIPIVALTASVLSDDRARYVEARWTTA